MTDSQGERDHPGAFLPTETSIDIRQVVRWAWRVTWSGKYMLLSCWLLAIVPTVLFYQQQTPLFTATATLMVEGSEASDAFSSRGDFRLRLNDSALQTEVGVLTSRVLAERVIDKLHLDQDPEFNPALREPGRVAALLANLNPLRLLSSIARPKSAGEEKEGNAPDVVKALQRAAIVDGFLSRLDATSQRRSYLINVSFTSADPERAALILNTLTQQYLIDRLEASFDDARRVTSWLEERLSALRQDVQTSETAVEGFRNLNGLRRSGDGRKTLTDQQLSELNSRLIIARTDLAQKQARLNQIRSLLQSGSGLDSAYEVLQSPLIQRLREQESILQREMSEALKTFGERHPKMVGYRADLEELQAKLRAEMQRISQGIANETEVARAGIVTLERELSQLRNVADTAGAAEIQLRELERQADATRSLYESFLQRFKREAETGSGGQRANARILSEAQIPATASYPRTLRGITLISLLSLLFSLILIFVIDRMDNAIRSSDEAEDLTGLPTLAVIPLFRGNTDNMIQVLADKPRSAIADSFRSLRVSLDARDSGGSGGRVISMTSSVPREGKTFASVCLAAMYARGDQKVLLIDSDVHRPRTHIMLRQKNDRGLLNILNGEASFEETVVRSIAPNLDFLPAGHLQTIAEEVHKDAAAPLLVKLRQEYDRIIIDLPPVLAVSDARALSTLSDQVIYLVRWNATARDAVRVGVRLLQDMNVNFAGVIISQINQTRHGQYAYGDYGTYYGRYNEYYTK